MTEAFTPGPWSSDLNISFTHVECADGEKTGRLAATVYSPLNPRVPLIRVGSLSDDPKEVLANTELVLAAKDLLQALEMLLEFVEAHTEAGEVIPTHTVEHVRSREAILKARGKS